MEKEGKSVHWRTNAGRFLKIYTASTEYDVTLVCDDFQELKAHKMVIFAASPFLRNTLSSLSAQPIDLFLPCFKYNNLYSLIN